MSIQLDHLIVPSNTPIESARLFAELLNVSCEPNRGRFCAVYVNDSLTFDFARYEQFQPNHYCFRVTDQEFDEIFSRIQTAGLKFRSTPRGPDDLKINTQRGGRNFYWSDSDGHAWEVLTVSYARQGVEFLGVA